LRIRWWFCDSFESEGAWTLWSSACVGRLRTLAYKIDMTTCWLYYLFAFSIFRNPCDKTQSVFICPCRFWRYQDDMPTPSNAAKHPLVAAEDDAATLAAAGILR
jgi:hypothetical protein